MVSEPDVATLTGGIALLLRGQGGVNPSQLAYARLCVEVAAIRLAVEEVTDEVIHELRTCIQKEECNGAESLREHASEFHLLLGRLSRNPILQMFITILVELTTQRIDAPARPEEMNPIAVQAHQRISEAIIAGDGGQAEHFLRRHFEAVAQEWRLTNPTFPRLAASLFVPETAMTERDGSS
jgi:DNA-binding FadR family transcriptional regulator